MNLLPDNLTFHASEIFEKNKLALEDDKVKIIVNQGGTRSGKTYSIMQLLAFIGLTSNEEISIVSQTRPHLKRGCIRDFRKIMQDWEIFDDNNYNRTDLIYRFSPKSYLEFFPADDGAKLRGPGRDYLFINECNLISYDAWQQLLMRTRKKVIIDYNPVDEFHWIYDKLITRDDCCFIQSTYKDNEDFLPAEQIAEIERLKTEDNNYWKIFGLGERATSTNLIYTNFKVADFKHEGETIYGLDFGYINPTALIKVSYDEQQNVYAEQIIYESGVHNSDLIQLLETNIENPYDYIYADSAEPQFIDEIKSAGFNIHPAEKSVKAGIDYVKRFNIHIHPNSTDLLKEIKAYKWKEDKNGNIIQEPVKFRDHLVDSLRYVLFSHRKYIDIHGNIPIFANNVHFTKHNNYKNNQYSNY